MSPTIVQRIEDDEHKGPWCSKTCRTGNVRPGSLPINAMPSTWSDDFVPDERGGRTFDRNEGRHGFWPDQWARWVGPDERRMLGPYFRRVTYMCPPGAVFYGEEQIVFDPNEAVRLPGRTRL